MRIIVLGGSGFVGSRTVEAARRIPNCEVLVASRHGPLVVDVTRPETFAALRGADVVVNLTNATRFAPDAVAAWCLKEGLTFIEATSDAPAVERLHALSKQGPHQGTLILGGGLFTGISNLMGQHCARALKQPKSLHFSVATSPFSGAGDGTINLMTDSLSVPTVSYAHGERVNAPLSRGPDIDFRGTRRPSLAASLAEPFMLHQSTGVPDISATFSPKPALLVFSFLLLPRWLLTSAPFLWFLGVYFTVLRKVLFASVATRSEMVVSAESPTGQCRAEVFSEDGMHAVACALAAMAEAVALAPRQPGVQFIDQRVELKAMVKRANELGGREVMTLWVHESGETSA